MSVAPPPGAQGSMPPPPHAVQGPKVSATWTGILLALGALVAAVGTFLKFETISVDTNSYSFTGIGSESVTGQFTAEAFTPGNAGKTIIVLSIVALVLGLLIAARKGRLWVSIVALVASAIGLILGIAAVGAAKSDADKFTTQAGVDVTGKVEIGAILAAAGMGVALVASILALVIRRRSI